MAFTRKSHDVNAYDREIFESTSSGRYFLEPASTYNKNTCFQETPEIHSSGGQYSISSNPVMADVESDLKGLIRKDTNDPLGQYPYITKSYDNEPNRMIQQCQAENDLSRSYSLLEAPAFRREQSVHMPRIDHEGLRLDPQRLNRIRSNQYIGINTRLFHRDTHLQKIPELPQQTDMINAPQRKITTFHDMFQRSILPSDMQPKKKVDCSKCVKK